MQERIFSMWMQAICQVVLTAALLWAVDQNDIKDLSIHFKAGSALSHHVMKLASLNLDDIFCCKKTERTTRWWWQC